MTMTVTREQVVEYLADLGDDEAVFDIVQDAINRIWDAKPDPRPLVAHEVMLVEVPDDARPRVMQELRRDHPRWGIAEANMVSKSLPVTAAIVQIGQWGEPLDTVVQRYEDTGATVEVVDIHGKGEREPTPTVGFLSYPVAR